MRWDIPEKLWPWTLAAVTGLTSLVVLLLYREVSATQASARRSREVTAWAEGFTQSMGLKDDFLMDALGRTAIASGAAACEVYSPSGHILFPPESNPAFFSQQALNAASSRKAFQTREVLEGRGVEVRYLPLGEKGVLRVAWYDHEAGETGMGFLTWVPAFLGALLSLGLGLFQEAHLKPRLPILPGTARGDSPRSLDGAPFRNSPSAHILLEENRTLASWGELESLLGSAPRPGEHISRWSALETGARLRAVVEGTTWPEAGLCLVRQEAGPLVILSFFLDVNTPQAS